MSDPQRPSNKHNHHQTAGTPEPGTPPPVAPAAKTKRRNVLRAPANWLVADTSHSLDTNRRITQGYIQLAQELHHQMVVGHEDFDLGG